MPGKILAHLDCASPYSYFALLHLRRVRPVLATYGITIDITPVFLGGINHATGNKPPSTLPAKAKYGPYDLKRAVQHFGTCDLSAPPFFPMVSLLPQRCMCVLKAKYPIDIYEEVFARLWPLVFNKHIDLAKPENMRDALSAGGVLTTEDAEEVMRLAGTKEVKAELNENTRRCIEEYGAFGAPWMWIVRFDEAGKEQVSEPVFGSDRWVYIYRLLGVSFEDVMLSEQTQDNTVAMTKAAKL